MNIAFFGTSNRSIPILESLNKNFNLKLCITKDDVKVGRGKQLTETGVKSWARHKRTKLVTISNTKPTTTRKIIEHLLESKIDLGIMADFSFIIPEKIINIPKHKIINIHFSLLPKYRGASPIQFSILNGDSKTGITYYVMDRGMDTGNILVQSEYTLNGTEISNELYSTLFEKASIELPKVINDYISGTTLPQPQKHENATYTHSKLHPKSTHLFKEDAKISWKSSVKEIERMTRAFTPWPIAWTTLKELCDALNVKLRSSANPKLIVKIYKTTLQNNELKVETLQIEGKNKMSWKDFLNGYEEVTSTAKA